MLAATAFAALSACATTSTDTGASSTSRDVPNWVQELQEEVSDLPELTTVEDLGAAPDDTFGPRAGRPQSLVGRRGSPAGGAPTAGSRDGGSPSGGSAARPTAASNPAPSENAPPPRSRLEAQYAGDLPLRPDRNLRQFGYDVVRARGERLAERGVGPVAEDHIVAAGDRLVVTIRSDEVVRHPLDVASDGTVLIPDVGTVRVAGRTLASARSAIGAAVGELVRDPEIDLFAGPAGALVVRIVGEVTRPGLLSLPSGATLTDALAAAGVRRSGSLRRVEHVRSAPEAALRIVDLYDVLIGSRDADDPRLEHGDRVVVPPIGTTVAVAGSVQRPAIYELNGPDTRAESVADALELAGGTTAFTVSGSMQIERTIDGARRLIDLLGQPERATVRDGDLLLVGTIDGRLLPVVEVKGQIVRPGRHQFRRGMTVGDLVRLAGGPMVTAYTRQAFLSRQVGTLGVRDTLLDGGPETTARRVRVLDLGRALAGDPKHDIALEPLDLLEILRPEDARDTPTVEVIGAVRRPGRYELTADMRVGDLIAIAGNLEPDAHRNEAELVRRVVDERSSLDVDRYRLDLDGLLAGDARDPQLATGDRVIVRRMSRAEVRVAVEGRVRFPGEYVLPAGSTVVEMLEAAGGVLPDADLRAAVFTRESVRRRQQDRWNDLVERSRQTMERNLQQRVNAARAKEAASAGLQLEQSRRTLERLRGAQATGRIVVPLTDPAFPTSDANLQLEPGDRLVLPRRSATVSVVGHVFNPVTIVHRERVSTDELLKAAGGLTDLGDPARLYVIRADGTVASLEQRHGRLRSGDALAAGDVVLVPPRPLSRDMGSVILDTLLLARTAMEAGLLGRGAFDGVGEANLSIVDSPASPRSDSGVAADAIRDFTNR